MSLDNQGGPAKRRPGDIARFFIGLILLLVAVEATIALYFQWRQVDQANAELRMSIAEGRRKDTQIAVLEGQLQRAENDGRMKATEFALLERQQGLESTLAAMGEYTLSLQETLVALIGPGAADDPDAVSGPTVTQNPADALKPTSALTDTPAATSTPTRGANILFSDVFETEDALGWMPAFGSWSVSGGRYICATNAEAWTASGEEAWMDYRVSAKVRLSGDYINVGVIGRMQDEQHFYMAQLYGGNARIFRRKNGWRGLVSVPYPIEAGSWYKLGLEFSGTQIHLYINDGLIVSVEDESYPSGKIGLYCSRCQASFDDILVTQPLR
jgi:hypothetical protein